MAMCSDSVIAMVEMKLMVAVTAYRKVILIWIWMVSQTLSVR